MILWIVRDTPSCSLEQYKSREHIHNCIAQPKEGFSSKRLGEHVGHILCSDRAQTAHANLMGFHFFTQGSRQGRGTEQSGVR